MIGDSVLCTEDYIAAGHDAARTYAERRDDLYSGHRIWVPHPLPDVRWRDLALLARLLIYAGLFVLACSMRW